MSLRKQLHPRSSVDGTKKRKRVTIAHASPPPEQKSPHPPVATTPPGYDDYGVDLGSNKRRKLSEPGESQLFPTNDEEGKLPAAGGSPPPISSSPGPTKSSPPPPKPAEALLIDLNTPSPAKIAEPISKGAKTDEWLRRKMTGMPSPSSITRIMSKLHLPASPTLPKPANKQAQRGKDSAKPNVFTKRPYSIAIDPKEYFRGVEINSSASFGNNEADADAEDDYDDDDDDDDDYDGDDE
jgi:hypothetical protein